MGSTTYSFCVRLRCFFPAIPRGCVKIKDGLLMPEEPECHLRRTLYKRFSQPECPRNDVFYVDPKGRYLPMMVEGGRQQITTEGMSWFDDSAICKRYCILLWKTRKRWTAHGVLDANPVRRGTCIQVRLHCRLEIPDCQGLPEPSGEFAIVRRVSSAD